MDWCAAPSGRGALECDRPPPRAVAGRVSGQRERASARAAAQPFFSDAMSMQKRYFTSDFRSRS
jgi:hypothetical protein